MDSSKFHETLRESQRAMADLYAWGSVIELLEGSSAPSSKHHNAAIKRAISIAQAESQKALKRMDSADVKLKDVAQRAQAQEGEQCCRKQ